MAWCEAGELGDIRFVTGHYHQDWLAKPTDWNWRLESEMGGALRSVGDIGTHWVDLTSFVTGLKPAGGDGRTRDLPPERQKPTGPVETFSSAAGATETVKVDTDDAAMIVIRYENGARGVMSTSQINMGRKNSLQWDVAGSKASAAWDSETPDHLFIGHRDGPNQVLMRDFTLMNATGTAAAACRRAMWKASPTASSPSSARSTGRRGGRAAGRIDLGHVRGRASGDAILRCGPAVGARRPLGELDEI
jgi:predicted dehydrogenase